MKIKLFAFFSFVIMALTFIAKPCFALADSNINSDEVTKIEPQYRYELYALSEVGATLYDNVNAIIYIKTDNPDLCDIKYNFGMISATDKMVSIIVPNRYDDITYLGDFDGYRGIYKVDNGYLINIAPKESGTYEFIIPELDKNTGEILTGCRFSIQVHDYETEENEWIDKIITSQTNEDMTNFEKMDSIAQYLRGLFIYPTYYSDRTYAPLASVPNSPFFKTNRADSAVSPDVLCDFAKRIGGFDKVDSLYDNYKEYGYSWSTGHFLCYCEADGTSKYYSACPAMSSGYVSKTTIDLNNTANLYKLKDITFLPRYEGFQKELHDCSATMSPSYYIYDGSAKEPKITVRDGSSVLTEGTDYIISYRNNTNVGTATATIIGIGKYVGTYSADFLIKDHEDPIITNSCIYPSGSFSMAYTGYEQRPFWVKFGGATLTEGVDYTIDYSNNTSIGTASCTITGIGKYSGSVTKTFKIIPNELTKSSVNISMEDGPFEYTGSEIRPKITITDAIYDPTAKCSKVVTLTEGKDYTLKYINNVYYWDQAYVIITGIGNYKGTVKKSFNISYTQPKPSLADSSSCLIKLSSSAYIYDGTAKTPAVTVKHYSTTLTNGTDYSVAYSNNINAGTATVTITGKGSYTGTISKTFTINTANINGTEVTLSATSYAYSGNTCRPNVTVKYGTKNLINGVDYSVEYKNNTNAGTATVTVTGKGNYSGSLDKTFTITPASISSATVSLSTTSYTYNGSAKKPTVTVKIGDKTPVNGADYSITYSNNVNAGTATVKVTGKGNYTGTINKAYTINAASISSATVTLSATSYVYNGSAKTPAVTVKLNGKTLKNGTDYSVTYSNNKNIGTATVRVTGKGNYKGTVNKSFGIYPANVTGTKTSSIGKDSITLTCNKVAGADGYIFYKYNPSTKKWVRVNKRTSNSYTYTKLSAGTNYRFTIRAYKTINGKEVLSKNYTSFYTSTIPATVSFTVKSNAKKKATLTWSKVTGATSYIVYYKTSKNGSWTRLTTLANNKTSYTKSGLTSGRTYYFTVKAVKNYNGKNYNGKYTSKSVKVR